MSVRAMYLAILFMGTYPLWGYAPDLTQPAGVQGLDGASCPQGFQQRFPFDVVEWQKEEEAKALLDRPVIISLSRRMDRFNVTEKLMEQAGFTHIERFEGVDGFRIQDASFFEELGIYTGAPGKKGCAASHLLVWKEFLAHDDREYLFIGEDDLLPHTHFAQLFLLYWGKTPKHFDIVLVGNQMSTKPTDPLVISTEAFCLHAYIISKAGAKRLLELYKTLPTDAGNIHVIDIFLILMMQKRLVNYYCYNGAPFPDQANLEAGNIRAHRDNGICFQNAQVEVCIHGK